MKTIQICQAEPIGDQVVESVTIEISQELRGDQMKWANSTLVEAARIYTEQARLIENALIESLPGGTYDRLCGLMLERKASHFVVSHGK